MNTRTPASCSPDVVALIAELRAVRCTPKANAWPPKPLKRFELAERAADALESMMREKDAMVERVMALVEERLGIIWFPQSNRNEFEALLRAALDMTVDKGE